MRAKPLPADPAEAARLIESRRKAREKQQRYRDAKARSAERRMNRRPATEAEHAEKDAAQAGLTITTADRARRPTFRVRMPEGTWIETLEPDVV